MDDINISVEAGTTKLLLVAGKRHTRNIMVTAEGGDNFYDAFWDALQDNGNRRKYNWAFFGAGWNDISFNPKYPIIIEGDGTNAFSQSGIVDTKVSIDLSAATNLNGLFYGLPNLVTIRKLVVSESTPFVATTFAWSSNLKNIEIEGTIGKSLDFVNSHSLSTESVQSIIDHLKDLTGQTAQTLTLHVSVGGRLTAEQKAAITAKNWTLVY